MSEEDIKQMTKWECLHLLTMELSKQRCHAAYCLDKIATGRDYLGDKTGDLKAAEASALSLEESISKILEVKE